MDRQPFFSVIIPTYNRALILEQCLNSLTKQTFKNFEVLVCDDGSKDNTKEIVETFRKGLDITYLWAENWGGPARPRNSGIKAAKGEWICFLDSDDSWSPEKLEIIHQYTTDYDVISHGLSQAYLGKIDESIRSQPIRIPVFENFLLKRNDIYTSSLCVRKTVVIRAGGFNEELKVVEDYDFLLRVAKQTEKFKQLPLNLGLYNMGTGDNIHNNIFYSYESIIKVLSQYRNEPLYETAIKTRKLFYFPYMAIFYKKEARKICSSIIGFNFAFGVGCVLLVIPTPLSRMAIKLAVKSIFKKYNYFLAYL